MVYLDPDTKSNCNYTIMLITSAWALASAQKV